MSVLSQEEVQKRLSSLPDWQLSSDNKLHREFRFADFQSAFCFMTRVAFVAEAMNHHPEWYNVYNVVHVDLCSHDVQGISTRDFVLAERMQELAAKFNV